MADVSCRMFEMYERGAAELGIPAETLLAGTTLTLEIVRNKRNRAPWNEWVVVCENFERAVGGPEAMRTWGYRIIDHDYTSTLRRLAGLLVKPEYLYRAVITWMAPVLYPHLKFDLQQTRHRLQLFIDIPPPHRGGAAWFRLVEGTLVALPRLLDLPDATVVSHIEERHASFDLSFSPKSGRFAQALNLSRLMLRPAAVLGVLEDVRRDIDEAYRAALDSERELRALLHGLPDPVAVISNGLILETNERWLEAFVIPKKTKLQGMPLQTFVAPEHEAVGRSLMGRKPSDEKVELLMRRMDGRTLVTECSVSQRLHYQGREAQVLIIRDVTARKEQDAILGVSQLGAMAAGIAHDINNPLTGVLGFLEMLDETLEDALLPLVVRESATRYLNAVREGAERVAAIAGDLVRFPRSTNDGALSSCVEDSLDSMARLARNEIRHRAVLVRDYNTTSHVAISPARLGQVLLNLLLHAAQSIPPGRAAQNTIRLHTHQDEDWVVIEISDTGPGVVDVKRVFEPFLEPQQNPNNASLGLAISRRIIDDCGGRIELDSKVGEGSTFRLLLPKSNLLATNPTDDDDDDDDLPDVRLKILVVDDELRIRELLSRMLRRHSVETAISGTAALAALERDPNRDLVFCDVMMPELTGVQVYQQLKQRLPQLAERFVFITGGAFGFETQTELDLIPNPRILKPFRRADVMKAVREAALQHE